VSKGTEGLDFVSKIEMVDDAEYKLHIWDTADFKFNSNIPPSLYDGVLGFVIAYDITRRVFI
jgi:GTPase SAR1 family protein